MSGHFNMGVANALAHGKAASVYGSRQDEMRKAVTGWIYVLLKMLASLYSRRGDHICLLSTEPGPWPA